MGWGWISLVVGGEDRRYPPVPDTIIKASVRERYRRYRCPESWVCHLGVIRDFKKVLYVCVASAFDSRPLEAYRRGIHTVGIHGLVQRGTQNRWISMQNGQPSTRSIEWSRPRLGAGLRIRISSIGPPEVGSGRKINGRGYGVSITGRNNLGKIPVSGNLNARMLVFGKIGRVPGKVYWHVFIRRTNQPLIRWWKRNHDLRIP